MSLILSLVQALQSKGTNGHLEVSKVINTLLSLISEEALRPELTNCVTYVSFNLLTDAQRTV